MCGGGGCRRRRSSPLAIVLMTSFCAQSQALGVAVDLGPNSVARCVEEAGVGFMYAPRYHPAMAAVRQVRKELGVSE